jgi:5'-3' exonuclease
MCWDGGTPEFRRKLVPTYKAGRKRADDPTWPAFLEQLAELEEVLPLTGVLNVKRRGIEADDLLSQAAKLLLGDNIIVSSDADMLQCVSRQTSVLKPGKKDVLYTNDNFYELVGYMPYQHVLAKVLMGDGSDNVPGVHGIGPKTAVKLLSSKDVFENATPKMKERIKEFIAAGKYTCSYTVMDLSPDLTGARMALLDAEWKRYSKSVYKWCIDRGFTSIIEAGSLGGLFGRLRKPAFLADGLRIPRIWDYRRNIG